MTSWKLLTAQELCSMELVSDRNLATAILWFSTFVVPCALPLKSIMRERQFIAGVASGTTFGRRNYQLRHQRYTNRTFFYLPASFFCLSAFVSYKSPFFLQKIFQNTVHCQPHAHANYQNVIFYRQLVWATSVTRASHVVATSRL